MAFRYEQMGFHVVFYALSTLFSAVKAISETLAVIRHDGTPKARAGDMVSYQDYCEIVDLKRFAALDETFGWA